MLQLIFDTHLMPGKKCNLSTDTFLQTHVKFSRMCAHLVAEMLIEH